MYCANCGVKLADTEKVCPLCGTTAYHPEIKRSVASPLYPEDKYPTLKMTPLGQLITITAFFLIPAIITLLVDYSLTESVTWSGMVIGSLLVAYVSLVLPFWFRKPNPVIFVPCAFAAVILFLFYIDLSMKSNWFLTFALPVAGFLAVIVSTVIALVRYVRKGYLYIFGGALIATGAFMPLMEYLLNYTFDTKHTYWSIYPLCCLVILGGLLLFFAICKPARESMEQRFFI